MATFARVQSVAGTQADPSAVTIATPTSGNLLVAVVSERSGLGHSGHSVSDSEGGWTKILGEDQELGDANARHSMSVWWKTATGSTLTSVTGDAGAGTGFCTVYEIEAGVAFTWSVLGSDSANSGTGSTSPQGTGTTANITAAGDKLVFTAAAWRNQSGDVLPVSWTTAADGVEFDGGTGSRSHATAWHKWTGTGTQTDEVAWDGSDHECAAAIVVFGESAGGGGVPRGGLLLLGVGF